MENKDNASLPVMMYVHGFMSGTNGAKQRQLQKHFKGRFRVVAPELDADPDKSLEILNRIIEDEKPEIIVGTSLGGWMTVMCESGIAELVIVNPATDPYNTLSQWLDEPQSYFCPRLDGNQTYTLTQEVLDKYLKYDTIKEIRGKTGSLHALCSTRDELIGDMHISMLTPLLPEKRLMIVDDFGHQCRDAGLNHLFEIIENLFSKITQRK